MSKSEKTVSYSFSFTGTRIPKAALDVLQKIIENGPDSKQRQTAWTVNRKPLKVLKLSKLFLAQIYDVN